MIAHITKEALYIAVPPHLVLLLVCIALMLVPQLASKGEACRSGLGTAVEKRARLGARLTHAERAVAILSNRLSRAYRQLSLICEALAARCNRSDSGSHRAQASPPPLERLWQGASE